MRSQKLSVKRQRSNERNGWLSGGSGLAGEAFSSLKKRLSSEHGGG